MYFHRLPPCAAIACDISGWLLLKRCSGIESSRPQEGNKIPINLSDWCVFLIYPSSLALNRFTSESRPLTSSCLNAGGCHEFRELINTRLPRALPSLLMWKHPRTHTGCPGTTPLTMLMAQWFHLIAKVPVTSHPAST